MIEIWGWRVYWRTVFEWLEDGWGNWRMAGKISKMIRYVGRYFGDGAWWYPWMKGREGCAQAINFFFLYIFRFFCVY
jgi:hypothetical protein